MKNLKLVAIATLTTATFLFSCGGEEKKEEIPATTVAPKSMLEETPAAGGLEARLASGKAVYEKTCQACHQADGKGIEKAFPPLAGSDYFASNPSLITRTILHGLSGKIKVNGKDFDGVMPKQTLSEAQIASVATYVLNSFGNKGGEVSATDVAKQRK